MPTGRSTNYQPDFPDRVRGLAKSGATDQEIADFLHIGLSTLYEYRHRYPEFKEAIREEKEAQDQRVENALFKKAQAGSEVAMIFWLKNRRRKEWQDRRTMEVDPDNPPTFIIKSILDKPDKE